jgi:hypothetical protein
MAASQEDLRVMSQLHEVLVAAHSDSKKPRGQRAPKNLAPWAAPLSGAKHERPLDVFDIGESSSLVAQLVRRRERAHRQGKVKVVQKLDKEIATAKAERRKKTKEVSDSCHHSFVGSDEDSDGDRWEELGFSEPPYCIVPSAEHAGFLELSARHAPVEQSEKVREENRLPVKVVGERDTPAFGLMEDGFLWRKATQLSIGAAGWKALCATPNVTASTFVLLGGQFQRPQHGKLSPLLRSVRESGSSVLVSNARARVLADEFAETGRCVPGLLEYVREQRTWSTDTCDTATSDVQPNASFAEVYDIADPQETDESDVEEPYP